ncbi:MAG TPA: orotate phosphoribosyltransferase [Candidatus Kapabacteria bacterium]|nr:orotate phosphoribosyltransferase [Candidatus Kapabacteria bacterium]
MTAVEFFIKHDVLQFGDFTLKSGRKSPYFFNTGRLCTGEQLAELGKLYADLITSTSSFADATVIFGSAYKGIPISVSTAIALSTHHNKHNIRSVSDRKEAKTHGDASAFLGVLNPDDKVVIVDDVITTGGTKYESIEKLTQAGCTVLGVVIAFDRMEPVSVSGLSAREEFEKASSVKVLSLCTVNDVVSARKDFAPKYEEYIGKVRSELKS